MSKLKCTTTSASTEEEISNGPFVFIQLEALASCLINDTLALHENFRRKSEFTIENFIKLNKNENDLEKITNFVQILQNNITTVEQELQEIEFIFNRLNIYVDRMEKLNQVEPFCLKRRFCACGRCLKCRCQSERKGVLEKLENIETLMPQTLELIEQMRELQNYSCKRNPYEKIFSILDCHCEALKNTERNMDLLQDKLITIEQLQAEIGN